MKKALINKLCCPFDKSDLDLQVFVKDTEENIIEGLMTCTVCKRYYPIAYGVPIMTPDEYRQAPLEMPFLQRWQKELKATGFKDFRLLDN